MPQPGGGSQPATPQLRIWLPPDGPVRFDSQRDVGDVVGGVLRRLIPAEPDATSGQGLP